MNAMTKQHVTYAQIADISEQPGTIHVVINRLNGYHVPFVFHTGPGGQTVGHGPIVQDGNMIASYDLDDLVASIKDTFGDISIYTATPNGTAPVTARVLH